MSKKPNSAIAVIGIGIGKNSFHIVGQNKASPLCCDNLALLRSLRCFSSILRNPSRNVLLKISFHCVEDSKEVRI
jgi:hypothetical protein